MRTLTLRNRFQGNSTIVENDFIDYYMTKANGEYVKVYLLLLRHLNTPDSSLTISKLADCLECTEKDIIRAFNYWSKMGLLVIDYDDAGTSVDLLSERLLDLPMLRQLSEKRRQQSRSPHQKQSHLSEVLLMRIRNSSDSFTLSLSSTWANHCPARRFRKLTISLIHYIFQQI